ncbi:MAG: rhomboid family intramembrane serine protease [Acidobacteriota bacterium]
MLIPVGADGPRRRLPIVTIALIVLNCLIHANTSWRADRSDRRLMTTVGPLIGIESEIERALLQDTMGDRRVPTRPRELIILGWTTDTVEQSWFWQEYEAGRVEPVTTKRWQEWHERRGAYQAAWDEHFHVKWGFRKSSFNPLTLFSSMFLHADFWHLLGNMLFLWAVGVNVEISWGRAHFLLTYLGGGVVAAASFGVLTGSDVPLIGASGAVATLMGAFLVRHFWTKLRFFCFFIHVGIVRLPAWVFIPFWVVEQIRGLNAAPIHGGGGVAFSAHLGGFFAGVLIAVLMRFTGVQAKLEPELERADHAREKARHLEEAELHQQRGDGFGLVDSLRAALAEDPSDAELHGRLLDELITRGRHEEASTLGIERLKEHWKARRVREYLQLLSRLDRDMPNATLPSDLRLRAASALTETQPHLAARHLHRLLTDAPPGDPLKKKALTEYAALLERLGDSAGARAAREQLRQS